MKWRLLNQNEIVKNGDQQRYGDGDGRWKNVAALHVGNPVLCMPGMVFYYRVGNRQRKVRAMEFRRKL